MVSRLYPGETTLAKFGIPQGLRPPDRLIVRAATPALSRKISGRGRMPNARNGGSGTAGASLLPADPYVGPCQSRPARQKRSARPFAGQRASEMPV